MGDFPIPDQPISIAAALRWAWAQFRAHPLSMIVPGVMSALGAFVVTAISRTLAVDEPKIHVNDLNREFTFSDVFDPPTLDARTIIIAIILYLLSVNVTLYFQNSTVSGAIRVARGERIGPKAFLVPMHFRNTVRTVTIACVALVLGFVLFVVPAVVVLYLWQFSVLITIGTETGPINSVKASYRITTRRVVASLLTLVVCIGLMVIGYLICFVGLIVAGPLAALVQVHCFRQIMGLPIAEPA
ncbi:hypothetical protein [Gordonia phthalatica]|uniref:Glycerophosphoryl diester phosphodiesterase membrane domain-containing protein n=1 Tax=Gordonia phthalatica TaxID=1136941 RepID=A0A0N9N8T1_9ACTN|nr:hypothetical protein [Gordonia phthalatica]ALG84578.1 hypothetical protein ACH46_08820 [Gordonia phthalatica]